MDACAENLEGLLENVDVIIDATDNFDIRFIINDFPKIISRGFTVLTDARTVNLYNYS